MGYYAIAAIALLAGGLGLAYVASDHFMPDDPVELADAPEPPAEDSQPADTASTPKVEGSAARRMDDFGSGPSGVTVTVPLKDRYDQAFSSGRAGGGGPADTSVQKAAPQSEVAAIPQQNEAPRSEASSSSPEDDVSLPGPEPTSPETRPETAALNSETEDDEPSYRVIERDTDAKSPEDGTEPSFDIVRVDPSGSTVMAGRAAPLTDVEIKVGDEVIDRVTTTAGGEWVSTPIEPLPTGDQQLSLTAKPEGEDDVESSQVVVVSIPEPDTENPPSQPVAVILDKDEGGEGRVLQAPDKLQSAGDGRLALRVVDYDEEGAIRLSGEAPPGAPVRIYIDNEPAALVIGSSKGEWITSLDRELPAGDYTLRLDQLDTKGQAAARLETPLTRVATPPTEGQAKVDYVVVQPGNSLWRIARRLSGDGFNYVYIFEANQAQIKDPDVIYPGQVFEVPTGVDIAG